MTLTSRRLNPTVARLELATMLRTAREQRGYSLDDLARRLDVSASQASRIDAGLRGLRAGAASELANWYGLDPARTTTIVALADESRQRAWWQKVDLDANYRTLIGMEQAAERICEYGGIVVPGLLQTEAYARAAITGSRLDRPKDRSQKALDVRMRRQATLGHGDGPRLWVVIDESALARRTGGSDVMRAQLEHLLNVSGDEAQVDVQVIGFEYGTYPSGGSHFLLLDMPPGVPHFVYSEVLGHTVSSTDGDDVARQRRIWEKLRAVALDPIASRKRITEYLDRL